MRWLLPVCLMLAACPPPAVQPTDGGQGEGEGEPLHGWLHEVPTGAALAAGRVGEDLMIVSSPEGPRCVVTVLSLNGELLLERDLGARCSAGAVSGSGATVAIAAGETVALDKGPLHVAHGRTAVAHVSPDGAVRVQAVDATEILALAAWDDGSALLRVPQGGFMVASFGDGTATVLPATDCAVGRLFSGDDLVAALLTPRDSCELQLPSGESIGLSYPMLALLGRGELAFRSLIPLPGVMDTQVGDGAVRGGVITLCGGRADGLGGLALRIDAATGAVLEEVQATRHQSVCSLGAEGTWWGANGRELFRLQFGPQTWGVPVHSASEHVPRHLVGLDGDLLAVVDVAAQADRAWPLPEGRVGGRAGSRTTIVFRVAQDQMPTSVPLAEDLPLEAFARSESSWATTFEYTGVELDLDPASLDLCSARIASNPDRVVVERWTQDGTLRWQVDALDSAATPWSRVLVRALGPATLVSIPTDADTDIQVGPETFGVPADHTLMLVLDEGGSPAFDALVEGNVAAIGERAGALAVLARGPQGTTIERRALDLGLLSTVPLELRLFLDGYVARSFIGELDDGDMVLGVGNSIMGRVTFDDDSSSGELDAMSGGALLRMDAAGRVRWLLNLPSTGWVDESGHLRGTAASPDGSRVAACGLTLGGPIVDERQNTTVAELSSRSQGAFCLELDGGTGAILQIRELEREPSAAYGVSYLNDEPVALVIPPSGAGPHLMRIRDGEGSVELHSGDFGFQGRLVSSGDEVGVTLWAPSRSSLAHLIPGFEVPGQAGQVTSLVLRLDRAALGL